MPKIAKNIPSPRNHAAERQKKTESTPIQGAREKPPSFRRGYAIGSAYLIPTVKHGSRGIADLGIKYAVTEFNSNRHN
jgi:hypothetical protein